MTTQDELVKTLLQSVLQNDVKTFALLLKEDVEQKKYVSLRYTLAVNSNANLLEVAFWHGNATAVFLLLETYWQHYEFIKAPCLWLPESVSIALLNYYALPMQETKLVLEKTLRLYTVQNIIQRRIALLATEEKQMQDTTATPLKKQIENIFPKHYEYFSRHHEKIWLKKYSDAFSFLLDFKKLSIIALQQHYKIILSKIIQQDEKVSLNFIEQLHQDLSVTEFSLNGLVEKMSVKEQELFAKVIVFPNLELEQEVKNIFLKDQLFIRGFLEDLHSCLTPEFIEYLNYVDYHLILTGIQKYETRIETKMKVYCQNISLLFDDICGKLHQFSEKNKDNHLIQSLYVESNSLLRQFLDFLQERNAFVLQMQKSGTLISTQSTREAFYVIYKYKQTLLNIIDKLASLNVQSAVIPEVKEEKAGTTQQIIITTDTQSAPSASVEVPLQQPVVQDKKSTEISYEPLTNAEYEMLRKAKLETYRESIEKNRKAKKMEKEAERKLAQDKAIQVMTTKTCAPSDFGSEFLVFLQRCDAKIPALIKKVKDFLDTNSKSVKHSDLCDLLKQLGFTCDQTTDGFKYKYGNFSFSYHRSHERRFTVDVQAVDYIKKAINASHVVQYLITRLPKKP